MVVIYKVWVCGGCDLWFWWIRGYGFMVAVICGGCGFVAMNLWWLRFIMALWLWVWVWVASVGCGGLV